MFFTELEGVAKNCFPYGQKKNFLWNCLFYVNNNPTKGRRTDFFCVSVIFGFLIGSQLLLGITETKLKVWKIF